jgi:hypothetical protein
MKKLFFLSLFFPIALCVVADPVEVVRRINPNHSETKALSYATSNLLQNLSGYVKYGILSDISVSIEVGDIAKFKSLCVDLHNNRRGFFLFQSHNEALVTEILLAKEWIEKHPSPRDHIDAVNFLSVALTDINGDVETLTMLGIPPDSIQKMISELEDFSESYSDSEN